MRGVARLIGPCANGNLGEPETVLSAERRTQAVADEVGDAQEGALQGQAESLPIVSWATHDHTDHRSGRFGYG